MSKVCLIVGGTGGLGRACAEDLASNGAFKVVVAGRNKSKGDDVVQSIKSKGGEATFIHLDITSPTSIKDLHAKTIATYGRLDAAVNGAGVLGPLGLVADVMLEDIESTLQINLVGVILSMQEQIRAMRSNPGGSGGRIVNMSSIYGLHGVKMGSIYAATKHALIGVTKGAALEYSNPTDNILVNCIAPGVVETEMTYAFVHPEVIPEGPMRDEMVELPKQYAQARYGQPSDVARGVRYLIESPWVTGTVLEVDGGFGAR